MLVGVPAALSAAHSFRMSVDGAVQDTGQVLSTVHARGLVDWTTNSADLQITEGGQTGQLIIIDGTLYLPRKTPAGSGGPKWVRVPVNRQPVLSGLDPLGDPLTTLSSLRDQLVGVTSDGVASVGGVSTTKLRGRLRVWGNAPGVAAAIEVWIDHQGQIRQLHLTGTGRGRFADITEQFSDFGVAVHIVAPPANDVTTVQRLFQQHPEDLDQTLQHITTCRAFLGSTAATRLADASATLNAMRRTPPADRGPASQTVRVAFAAAAIAACTRKPDEQWPLVLDQLYLNNERTYDR